MTDRLPDLTDILTVRDFDTPYGVIPAGTFGTIVSPLNLGGYLAEFSAPGTSYRCHTILFCQQGRFADLILNNGARLPLAVRLGNVS